ncbi:flagellar basal body L-ring protein FlgH [Paucibacter sp. KBW04]|uniref:flagellar basal body L-ring protein FlgH n=1 Tax=Paucibacter sp. KBW04 TaxID=2153361 RepID=UPI002101F042|nr:flagellar basal body L-ring protein FlgH [Paucibacter sp. KBW04]
MVGSFAQTVESKAGPAARGSLYSESSYQALTSDRRGHKVGDLVTVIIFENASASSTADTGANRDSNVGLSISTPTFNKSAGVGANSDFSGGGRTQRAGKVLGQLTVFVREVLANGDLFVSGEQSLEVNGERQVIKLEGHVRPKDITELNTVLSTRVADAKISFSGDGVLGDRQRPAWWQKLLGLFGV